MKAYTKRQENEIQLFFEAYERRDNIVLYTLLTIFVALAKFPSIVIEAFYRRKLGERYFTLSSSLFIFLVYLIIAAKPLLYEIFGLRAFMTSNFDFPLFLFACAFLYKSIQQRREISKYGTTYNLERFSLSQGEYHPFFEQRLGRKLFGIPVTSRTIQMFFEPVIPFALGVICVIIPFTRTLGTVLIVSSILASIRQFVRVVSGRHAVLDIIDQHLISQDKAGVLMEQRPIGETHGIRLPVALPEDKEVRKLLLDETTEEKLSKDSWED